MDFYTQEYQNSVNTKNIDTTKKRNIEFYKNEELSTRTSASPSNLPRKTPEGRAFDLMAEQFSLSNTQKTLHNSSLRKEFVAACLPAFDSPKQALDRLNESHAGEYSRSLLSRASKVVPEKSITRAVLKSPVISPQSCQQVSIQAAHAKQFLDDVVPPDSYGRRKFASTKEHLFKDFLAHQKKCLPYSRPLNRTYFFELCDEMHLSQVKTIQQCSYCFDLKRPNELSPERLATCFLHDHYRRHQLTAYLLDKKQLSEGILIFNIIIIIYYIILFIILFI
jgi:hypothetical protein